MAPLKPAFKGLLLTPKETSNPKPERAKKSEEVKERRMSTSSNISNNLRILETSKDQTQLVEGKKVTSKENESSIRAKGKVNTKRKRRSSSTGETSTRIKSPYEMWMENRERKEGKTYISERLLHSLSWYENLETEEENSTEDSCSEDECSSDEENRTDDKTSEKNNSSSALDKSIQKTRKYLLFKGARSTSTPDLTNIPKYSYDKAEKLTLYHLILIYEKISKRKVKGGNREAKKKKT